MKSAWSVAALSAVEDAGLNASAPAQQLWLDGWLVRLSPGKAKRSRCINALAAGRRPLQERLAAAQSMFDSAGLEMVVRITPFTEPAGLDGDLAALGLQRFDCTCVLVGTLAEMHLQPGLAQDLSLQPAAPAEFATIVGDLRGSPRAQRQAQVQRLLHSPVPYEGWVLRRRSDVLACGQTAREGALVGLYDVFTAPEVRNRGLATALCAELLRRAQAAGATCAYLQVDAGNAPALQVYRRLGFTDGYSYHYRARHPERA